MLSKSELSSGGEEGMSMSEEEFRRAGAALATPLLRRSTSTRPDERAAAGILPVAVRAGIYTAGVCRDIKHMVMP
jgi:hypothetical protein